MSIAKAQIKVCGSISFSRGHAIETNGFASVRTGALSIEKGHAEITLSICKSPFSAFFQPVGSSPVALLHTHTVSKQQGQVILRHDMAFQCRQSVKSLGLFVVPANAEPVVIGHA